MTAEHAAEFTEATRTRDYFRDDRAALSGALGLAQQGREIARRQGPRNVEPLRRVAALRPEKGALGICFHTFRDNAQAEGTGEANDGAHDGLAASC